MKFEQAPPAPAPLEALGDWLGLPPAPRLLAIGRGYGHGVGMSQWGAYALAQRGEGYPEILRYYFRGTDLRPYSAP